MVSVEYQNFVYEVIETQQDFNIKLIIFAILIFYGFLFYYMNSRMQIVEFWQSVFALFSKIYIYVMVFFMPWFTIMLFRDYAAIQLWTFIIQMYTVVFVITAVSLFIFGWQRVLETVGIEFDIGIMQREKMRKGEK